MRSPTERDALVAREQAAFAEHPTFESWPVVEAGQVVVHLDTPFDQAAYVKALYELCETAEPAGRVKGGLTGDLSPLL